MMSDRAWNWSELGKQNCIIDDPFSAYLILRLSGYRADPTAVAYQIAQAGRGC
jgi:hypothetical protein